MAVSKFGMKDWLLGWLVPADIGMAAVQAVALTDTAGVPVGSGAPLSVTVVNAGGAATPVVEAAVVSTGNSSTNLLGANQVFTGPWVSVLNYGAIVVNVISDQASAANGLSIQQSSDGINADDIDAYTTVANTALKVVSPRQAAFARVVYTNGAVAQGSFRIQTILSPQMPTATAIQPGDGTSLSNDFAAVAAVTYLYNGTTEDLTRSINAAGNTGTGTAAVALTELSGTRLTKVTLNITTATTTAVIAGTASQLVRVYKVVLNVAAAQTINVISSGGASLVGAPMSFGANGGLVLDFDGEPWWTTVVAEGLSLVTTTTGAVTGTIYYIKAV
jgi:hypothetical protein